MRRHHLLMRAFPRSWRRRYGAELLQLIEDEPGRRWQAIDLLRAGLGERCRRIPGLTTRWGAGLAVLVVLGIVVGRPLVVNRGSAPSPRAVRVLREPVARLQSSGPSGSATPSGRNVPSSGGTFRLQNARVSRLPDPRTTAALSRSFAHADQMLARRQVTAGRHLSSGLAASTATAVGTAVTS